MEDKKRLLLVEDDFLIALSKEVALAAKGYVVKTVNSGEKAVAVTKNTLFDLVLMDINLGPGIEGISAAEQILKEKEIPIIFHSSLPKTIIIEKAGNISNYGIIPKTADLSKLDILIRDELDKLLLRTNSSILT